MKALITCHAIMRDGSSQKVYRHLTDGPGSFFNMSGYMDKKRHSGVVQSRHVRLYAAYLEEKLFAFRDIRVDYSVSNAFQAATEGPDDGAGLLLPPGPVSPADTLGVTVKRLRAMDLEAGLFRHVDVLLRQIERLLESRFPPDDVDNVITLCAYRYMVRDLLKLYHALNELVINLLGRCFTMHRKEAIEAIGLYRHFATLTDRIVAFCEEAEQLKHHLGFSLPKLTPVRGRSPAYYPALDFCM
jgi:hypothetical protein